VPRSPKSHTPRPLAPGFSFRWGIPVLDNLPFTVIYHFLLDHYAELGVDPLEMMFIIHLSQFRHETPSGQATPGLPTLARLMGYKDEQQVRRIKHRLEAKGLLRVTARPGLPDVYDVAPFAAAAFHLWQAEQQATPNENDTPIENDRGITPDSPTPIQNERGPLSDRTGEKERIENIKGDDSIRGSLSGNTSDMPPPYSPIIAGAVLDLARTLRDDLAGPGAVGEALWLWQRSGWSETAFVAALQAARGKQPRLAGVLAALGRRVAES